VKVTEQGALKKDSRKGGTSGGGRVTNADHLKIEGAATQDIEDVGSEDSKKKHINSA